MSSQVSFDFGRLADSFAQMLPVLAPVTTRIMEHIPEPAAGAKVLDVACGTGEPGLTLAERFPGLELVGVEAAEPMVGMARTKAARRGITGVRFAVQNSQQLDLPDESTDLVVSRFGVLSFADPRAESRELARVMRPGAAFSIATWDAASKNILTYAISEAVGERLPAQATASIQRLEHLAMPGRREQWLVQAGLSEVASELWSWSVEFPHESAMWELATGPAMLGAVLKDADDDLLARARVRFGDLLSDYRSPEGSYTLPYACRLIWGRR
ncbi:class I SAM-dependent methyltransferase [Jidongwangia harbinensis]|uniref:class I SAM-dependent methyltransferase n=1 Tax=Jidongwangia harbinensis TaxID=2878561 RepID=UPI001CD9F98C|nr:class I SAM-dependent methyltransferase [Jidongwangia harbinensis]MCA2216543.1 class I SAM-dependent methyltransferase [Jidongwangia harbinensis]